jgi:hypothetical protein
MNKPKSFYDVADEFGEFFGEKPLERVEPITQRVIGFSAETLRECERLEKEST